MQLIRHKRRNQSAQVGAAAGAAHHNVRVFSQLLHGLLAFQTDDGLVQQHLIQHAAQHIALGAFTFHRGLHGLGNGAAERTGGAGIFCQNFPAGLRSIGGRGGHVGVEHPHNRFSERFLLIRAFHHVHVAVQTEIAACLAQSGAPLTGAGFRGYTGQTLLLGVISLGYGGIQLVRPGGVVALKFVVNLCRGVQRFFQLIGADQGGGTVHFVHVLHSLGNVDVLRGAVQLLLCQFLAENGEQVLQCDGLQGAGVEHGVRLLRHHGAEIEPLFGHLVFGEVQSVGNGFHG